MKISKITKILPLVLALSLSIGCANAEDPAVAGTDGTEGQNGISAPQQVNYSLSLSDYIQITQPTAAVTTSEGTYGPSYTTLDLTNALTANFKVITNSKKRTLTLTSPSTATNTPSAMYGYDPAENEIENFYLVFVHSGETVPETAVTSITSADPEAALIESSPNAFAFKVNSVVNHTYSDGGAGGTITGTWDTDHIKYVMDNGIATLGFTMEKQAMTDTFNTRDTSGTYTATLILTDLGVGAQ